MKRGGPVSVNLSHLSLDVTLVDRLACYFEQLDGLTEVLDCLLVLLLPKLVVAFLLQSSDLVLQLCIVNIDLWLGLLSCLWSGGCCLS